MVKQHIKRQASPKSWPILRKSNVWITRPFPGAHSFKEGYSIETLLKEVLNYAQTRKEVRHILKENEILVDGRRVTENKFLVGLFDTISFPLIKENFRIVYQKGKLSPVKISQEEASTKLAMVTGKTYLKKGLMQINLNDGRNIVLKKDSKEAYAVGDVLLLTLPETKVKEHLRMDKGVVIYLIGGKHLGVLGFVESVNKDKLKFKAETGESFETLKEYAFVVGKEKPLITLREGTDTPAKKETTKAEKKPEQKAKSEDKK